MTDVITVPASVIMPPPEPADFGFMAEEPREGAFHREINERRGRVENPEMLRRLRSL